VGATRAHRVPTQAGTEKAAAVGSARQQVVAARRGASSTAALGLSPQSILAVQRLAGNRAVRQILRGRRSPEAEQSAARTSAMTEASRGRQPGGAQSPQLAFTPEFVQRFKVEDDHVRADMRHAKGKTLFLDHTWDDIEGRVGGDISTVSNATLETAIRQSREADMMDYNQLSKRKVSSEKQLTTFMNESPDDEHMYVLHEGELHVAIRAGTKKLPHPTLVGGDPDAECAGTMRQNVDGSIVVTASSGHFRPFTERKGQQAVDAMMSKTSGDKYKKDVKGSRR
jgi:hypothetical protein